MTGSPRPSQEEGIVLWARDSVSCTCLRLAPDQIVISLFSSGVMLSSRTFPNEPVAVDYATALMNAYGAR